MATGNKRTNFSGKRHMPQQRVKDTFFDYLANEIWDTARRIWADRRGVFGEAILQGDGNDKFKVSNVPIDCLDGEGHILTCSVATAQGIQFENTVSVVYHAGMHHCLVPSLVARNPRTGILFYDLLEDCVGLSGVPNTVLQAGGSITVTVDSVFETGVSHAGRKVSVWLNLPKSTNEAVAIERDLTVEFTGGKNVVHTGGLLGQSTVSTNASDYAVAATGVTVRRNTDLRAADPYAFLGTVTGAGAGVTPSAFDVTEQIDVTSGLNPTLDIAYDGGPGGGPGGSGREIVVDSGAVELNTVPIGGANDTDDAMHAQMRLSRLESTDWFQAQLQLLCGDMSHVPIAALQPVQHVGSPEVCAAAMAANLSGTNLITLTGASIDLTDPRVRTNKKLHAVLLEDCPQAGLYVIDTFGAKTIYVKTLEDGAPASWPAGTATCRLMVPRFTLGGALVHPSALDWWRGPLFVLRDGDGGSASPTDFRIMSEGAGRVVIYDNSKTAMTSYYEPRELVVINPAEIGQDLLWPVRFHRSVLIDGGDVQGTGGEEVAYDRDGLRIYDAGGTFENRDTAFALAIDFGFPEDIPTYHSLPTFSLETTGAMNRGHHFRDDFIAYQLGAFSTLGPYTTTRTGGRGTATICDITDGVGYGHGCVELVSGNQADDVIEVALDPLAFNLDAAFDFRWMYRARVKLADLGDVTADHGFYRCSENRAFWFNLVAGVWYGAWIEPGPVGHATAAICAATADTYQWFEIFISSSMVIWTVEQKDHAVGSFGSESAAITTLNAQAGALGISCRVKTATTAAKTMLLDYWEVWDREAIVGRHGASHNLQHP